MAVGSRWQYIVLQEMGQHRWAQGHLPSCTQQKWSENTSYSLTLAFTTEVAGEQPAHTAAPPAARPGALCLPVLPGRATALHTYCCACPVLRAHGHGTMDQMSTKLYSRCSQLPSDEWPQTEARGAVAVIWHLATLRMTEPSSHLLTIMDLSSSTSCSSSANSLKDSAVRKEEAGQWSWDVAPECGTHVRTPQCGCTPSMAI